MLLGILVSLPLFKSGYFSHQDDLQVIRLVEMRKCFSDLQIPCRWVPDMGWGNGFPLFNFYGVSTYYIGGVLSYVTGYLIASKILFFIGLVLGSFGLYLLANELWGKYAGLTSAVLYMFAPYKALDIYVRGALAESMALTIIPFVFYFGYKLVNSDNYRKYGLLFTISLFLFLITHNIMTIVFLPFVAFWMSYLIYNNKFKRFNLVAVTSILAFGLSSFFVIPAFLEKDLVQTESLTRFELDYRANFVSIRQLFIDRVWGYGTSIPGPEGGMNFQIGWPHWILAFISLVVILFGKSLKHSFFAAVCFILFAFSVLMTHNKSTFIWESFSILNFFQFPWRFLSLSILTTSILGGFLVSILKGRSRIILSFVLIAVTIYLNITYFKPREIYSITEEQKLSGELWDLQRKGALLDYLPKTALEPREGAPINPIIVTGKVENSEFKNLSNRWILNVEVIETARIEVPVYYFPKWTVYVNGKEYPFDHNNILGRISFELPVGKYEVTGYFKNTPIRSISNTISLVSLIVVIILWKKYKK